jgi:peptide/nickel transport system permease protein
MRNWHRSFWRDNLWRSNFWRNLAGAVLLLVVGMSLAANWLAPVGYAKQYREEAGAAPTRQHWLGTDEIGRDRFARVLYGTRISLLLAPVAALLSTLMAALVGGLGGYLGGRWASGAMAVTDLFLSLPWLFLLITVRAIMPLNVTPLASVVVTFLMLGLLGWTNAARVLCSTAGTLRQSDFVRQARASGVRANRLFWIHVLPNLKPVLYAQFWISIPVFILSEANLGILGLGVAEPMPSWGSLLKELEGMVSVGEEPWKFVPLILLVVVVTSFQLLLSKQEEVAA